MYYALLPFPTPIQKFCRLRNCLNCACMHVYVYIWKLEFLEGPLKANVNWNYDSFLLFLQDFIEPSHGKTYQIMSLVLLLKWQMSSGPSCVVKGSNTELGQSDYTRQLPLHNNHAQSIIERFINTRKDGWLEKADSPDDRRCGLCLLPHHVPYGGAVTPSGKES